MKYILISALLVLVFFRAPAQELPRELQTVKGTRVVVFLGLECPISQKYLPALNALSDVYAKKGVHLLAVVPGEVKRSDLRKFIQAYQPAFPVFSDRKYEWVKALKATVTPEAFLLDDQSNLQYRGAIDDWFYELGVYRKEATRTYLADAINAVMEGREPAVKKTKALGCSIEMSEPGLMD